MLLPALAAYGLLAWAVGGATVDVTSADEIVEIIALPLLLLGLVSLLRRPFDSRLEAAALAAMAMILLLPLAQLLPLPASIWMLAPERAAVASDLAQSGVTLTAHRWSLFPFATERAAWALLPALACFVIGLQLDDRQRRRMAQFVLGLVLANLVFGFFQVGLPPGSSLRLHAGIGSGFSGVLVNDNHQATALVIGMLVAVGLLGQARREAHAGRAASWKVPAYAAAAVLCLAGIIPTTSRAGMTMALVALVIMLAVSGVLPTHRLLRNRQRLAAGVLAFGAVLLGILSAWRWLQVDDLEENRGAIARATVDLAHQHAPLGSGIGGFVSAFMQGGSPLALGGEYVNHAHNEYAQWWMTGGVAAMVVLVACLLVLAWIGWVLVRSRPRDGVGIACWLAACVVLAHSWVDFPLRTISIMSLTATLAGLAVAAAKDAGQRQIHARASRGTALQRA